MSEPDETDEPGETGETGEAWPPTPAWRARVLPVVLVVLLVALTAAALLQVRDRDADTGAAVPVRPADIGVRGQDPDGPAGSAVLAARKAVVAFYRIDHRRVDRDLARLPRLSTSGFGAEYRAMTRRLKARVQRQRLVSSPRLTQQGTATEYLVQDAAQVLVSVDVSTRRGRGETRRAEHRTRVTLQRVDGAWLVAGLDEVGTTR